MGLARRYGDRNPLEFGHDGLGLRTLAYHRIAQGDLDLPRTAHRSEYDAALNADLDDHGGAVYRAFAGGLAERKLVAQSRPRSRRWSWPQYSWLTRRCEYQPPGIRRPAPMVLASAAG